MEGKDKNKAKIGVYLNLKTRLKQTNEIFDYSSTDNINEMNTFITGRIYLYRLLNNDIVKSDPGSSKEDELLLLIRKKENSYEIDNITYKLNPFNSENSKKINNYLWYVINSEPSINMINPNEDYYLKEGDIIKFGKVKYFVKKICIKKEEGNSKKENDVDNKNNIKKEEESMNIFIPECLEFKKCEFCNENIFKLCKCKEFQHLKCIQKWIKERKIERENKKKSVNNYFINIYYCEEYINKDPRCEDSECIKDCKCIKCNTYYPLKFKYFDKNDQKEKEIDIFGISKPKSNYMILESIETNDEYKNLDRFIKYIHVIKLNKDVINIGRGLHNDVIIDHSSVCKEHAIIKYNDGKILLKNKSKKAGTLVLIQDKSFKLTDKEIYLQVNKTFIEAKIMEEKNYKTNEKSKYPLLDKKANK